MYTWGYSQTVDGLGYGAREWGVGLEPSRYNIAEGELRIASEVRVIEDIITMGNKMVEECSRTAFIGKESRHRRISSTQWSRPSTSWIRLNVDTMESTFDNKAGVGMSFEITKGDGYLDFLD
ncbi:hypothetical protein V6N12_062556 [Hibiscus sabdariffa]|uniref:Uncharacterized protein n=1 Tax=Hibiscus sabdariffa TaxID=183260 RepID=A0ABR2F992_9ROSI